MTGKCHNVDCVSNLNHHKKRPEQCGFTKLYKNCPDRIKDETIQKPVVFICPRCKKNSLKIEFSYCPMCGQRVNVSVGMKQ